jgi:hypothetical protein
MIWLLTGRADAQGRSKRACERASERKKTKVRTCACRVGSVVLGEISSGRSHRHMTRMNAAGREGEGWVGGRAARVRRRLEAQRDEEAEL